MVIPQNLCTPKLRAGIGKPWLNTISGLITISLISSQPWLISSTYPSTEQRITHTGCTKKTWSLGTTMFVQTWDPLPSLGLKRMEMSCWRTLQVCSFASGSNSLYKLWAQPQISLLSKEAVLSMPIETSAGSDGWRVLLPTALLSTRFSRLTNNVTLKSHI